jgi:hypothetical protein
MDLALSIAIGSSLQVALFVAPVLVLLGLAVGLQSMDLASASGPVLIIVLSALITRQLAADGRSDCPRRWCREFRQDAGRPTGTRSKPFPCMRDSSRVAKTQYGGGAK